LNVLGAASVFVKLVSKVLKLVVFYMYRKSSKDDPMIKAVINTLEEAPLDIIVSSSGGSFSIKIAKGCVHFANKSIFKGIMTMLGLRK
jgi:hypothetical protein